DARTTIQNVVVRVAIDRIGEIVSRTGKSSSEQRQDLYIARKRIAGRRRLGGVGTPRGGFDNDVVNVFNDVRIVTGSSNENIGTRPAIQRVVVTRTRDDVDEPVTRPIDRAGASERQILHVAAQRVGEPDLHEVDAF